MTRAIGGRRNENVSEFDAALIGCAALDEEALARPWTWRGRQTDVRYALYRTLEDAQEAHVRASAGEHPESRRILALAPHAFGALRRPVAGLPGPPPRQEPRPGEGRRIGGRLAAVVGEVEGVGAVADAREVEARLAERLASVRL